jgi:hypothetical protein
MRFANIKHWLLRNFGLRALSVLIAAGLWLFVNAGQHEAQTSMLVPVDYRGLPPGLMIVNRRPDFVALSISGPRTLLSLLDSTRLTVHLDLSGSVRARPTSRSRRTCFASRARLRSIGSLLRRLPWT